MCLQDKQYDSREATVVNGFNFSVHTAAFTDFPHVPLDAIAEAVQLAIVLDQYAN
jgi:hypothetical protein